MLPRTKVDICCVVDVSGSMGKDATYEAPDGTLQSDGLSILDEFMKENGLLSQPFEPSFALCGGMAKLLRRLGGHHFGAGTDEQIKSDLEALRALLRQARGQRAERGAASRAAERGQGGEEEADAHGEHHEPVLVLISARRSTSKV